MTDVEMVFTPNEYPWLATQWHRLEEQIRANRLPHALLLSGISGLGKRLFSDALAQKLLCSESGEVACQQCKNCQLYLANSHPDLFYCEPEEGSKVIKVDQVRELNDFVSQSAQIARYKVVILDPAAALNLNSANALLKNLEEPSGNAIYILLDHQSGHVLPTIRSRCQAIDIRTPGSDQVFVWLDNHLPGATITNKEEIEDVIPLALGAPLTVKTLIAEGAVENQNVLMQVLISVMKGKTTPVDGAKEWLKNPVDQALTWQVAWLESLIRYQQCRDDRLVKPKVALDMYRFLADCVPPKALFELRHQLLENLAGLSSNLNESLLMENLLVNWQKLMGFRKKKSVA